MIRRIKICDRCKKEISEEAVTYNFKHDSESHLCRRCAKAFCKWLKNEVEE